LLCVSATALRFCNCFGVVAAAFLSVIPSGNLLLAFALPLPFFDNFQKKLSFRP
jgi:hypothetical protein